MSKISSAVLKVALICFIFFYAVPRTLFAEELTLGLVQSKVKKGMSQGEVAEAIGSPNLASKDRNGNETWIYDKISSETETEGKKEGKKEDKSSGVIGGLFLGLGAALGHSKEGSESTKESTKEKVTTTKQTLTVVIKFDENSLVKDVNYHMSKF